MAGRFVIGIDTSAYTTSLALVDSRGKILLDSRRMLPVPEGMRGLRQSEARVMHISNLPEMISDMKRNFDPAGADAVAFSDRPRPVEGSYMPVFTAGADAAKQLSGELDIPCFAFSHQEGHIAAVKEYSSFRGEREFLCYHLSGGTCELLLVRDSSISIIGGSKDISFGQLIDRIGVRLGMSFPAGRQMDETAMAASSETKLLKDIPVDGLRFNLSGIETQCLRSLDKAESASAIVREVFVRIAECLSKVTEKACRDTGIGKVIFVGGVSSSRFVRRQLNLFSERSSGSISIAFGDLSEDNAIGTAILGGEKIWQQSL